MQVFTVSIYHIYEGRYGLISPYTGTHGQYLPYTLEQYGLIPPYRCSRSVSTMRVLAVSIYHTGARGQYLSYMLERYGLISPYTGTHGQYLPYTLERYGLIPPYRCSRSVSTISATRQMVCALICDHLRLFLLNHGELIFPFFHCSFTYRPQDNMNICINPFCPKVTCNDSHFVCAYIYHQV
jgi:hypothetical protein